MTQRQQVVSEKNALTVLHVLSILGLNEEFLIDTKLKKSFFILLCLVKANVEGFGKQQVTMSSLSADRKPPLDYGVQIRFIKDLDDGGFPDRSRLAGGVGGINNGTPSPSKYGVAVRVQGISGQPYVVLKDGEKGDSYGVQLKTQPQIQSSAPIVSQTSPYNTLLLGQREGAQTPQGSYIPAVQPSCPDEDFGSPLRRPPGDGQAGTQGEAEARSTECLTPSAVAPKVDKKDDDSFNEAGLRKVRQNGIGSSLNGTGLNGASLNDDQAPAIDTKSLAPINKLISRFGGGSSGDISNLEPRTRLHLDNRVRSHSVDVLNKPTDEPPTTSPMINPYASITSATLPKLSSPKPSTGSLGRDSTSVAKVAAIPNSKPLTFSQSPKLFVPKEGPTAVPKKPVTPDLIKSQTTSAENGNGEDSQTKQAIYNILKEGSIESESAINHKASLIHEGFCGVKILVTDSNMKTELEQAFNKNTQLQQLLDKTKRELQENQDQMVELRMDREAAESRLQQQEDQLAQLQEELRRTLENSPQSDAMQLDLMTVQAELSESLMLKQKLEDTLRQRERELTALKGALKDEVESHDKEIEAMREQYSQDMDALRHSMETVSQSQLEIEEERQKVNASILALEEELEGYKEQSDQWKKQLSYTNRERGQCSAFQKLLQAQQEKEELEEKLLAVKKQTDETDSNCLMRQCRDDLKKALSEVEKQKAETAKREEELKKVSRANENREKELKAEIDRLIDQSKKDKEELAKILEKTKQPSTSEQSQESNLELQEANARLRERIARMTRLHSSVPDSSSDVLEDENRSLRNQLEESRRAASRLGQEKEELSRRLEEREREREALRRGKSDLEEQKRLLDRALEKISKEMETMMGDSRQSVQVLQSQLDEFRDRSRRELQDAQRLSKDRLVELQRVQALLKSTQEEVSRLKKELLSCSEERDSAQLDKELLNSRLKHLENELETERSSQTDRSREIRLIEDKVKTLEIELDEEKSGAELLNERIARSREQVDQLRSELMQERSARHDLEMDKSALERQVKELKSRIADMGSQTRPSAGVTMLENKIQELEDRLRSEEREKNTIVVAQRRLDRKLKDVTATLDQERSQHAEQRDQLSLRVKALKRQLDESEGEVERLEGVRRKVLRDLEEQRELQEALQVKVNALENELKRKVQQSRRPALESTLSSEEEESYSDSKSITSILTETPLQTTNC
ncbi:cingulin-like isoform X1 [Cyprinus carpio]|uniref:Cingulin-like isoform X1 n=1 Tax=Cyprinus carpio TaxID=7962 RepID=A0A9Q9UZS7_CYPCA|nr:cingulin-like isoform X1 [Cyprinus carpio]